MADVHRKIELQEQDDLRYLISNARRCGNERINDALPRMEGEDAFRGRVEELVHEYLAETYRAAAENITVNGLPPSPALLSSLLDPSSDDAINASEEYEPLDSKLHTQAAELMRREADLLEEIAALKREVPAQAAESWKMALKAGLERDEEALRNASQVDDRRDVRLGINRGERQEEMEKTWERGVQGLERLKNDLPGTTARMERAKRAAEYTLAEEKGKSMS